MRGVDEDETIIRHEDWCAADQHTDPADDCFTQTVTTHGIVTHIYGRHAHAELRTMMPLTLTAAACLDLASRFTDLAQLLTAG